jgi:hypothetical protein
MTNYEGMRSEWLAFSSMLEVLTTDLSPDASYSLFCLLLNRLLGAMRSARFNLHLFLDLLNLLRNS